jgi:3-hydroxy-D-aspartate aldolase
MGHSLTNSDLIDIEGGALRLTTPSLILDLSAVRRNLNKMSALTSAAGLALRPHIKTHKCSALAKEQIKHGASGICCATAHEAIMMARDGMQDILVTSPVVQSRQIAALAAVYAEGTPLTIVIDHPSQIAPWNDSLSDLHPPLPALVDVDIGMGRTGVRTEAMAVKIAELLRTSRRLTFAGVQAYSGMVQHIKEYAARRSVYLAQLDHLKTILKALKAAGLEVSIVSGGGTGSIGIDIEQRIFTECQAGSYVFMDVEYNAIELFDDRHSPFETSLWLRTTVISANADDHITLNAGFKCLATDGPLPKVRADASNLSYHFFGDEYGRLSFPDESLRPALGSVVDLITPHCDPTVNLHDSLHVVDGDTLIDIWRINARGSL